MSSSSDKRSDPLATGKTAAVAAVERFWRCSQCLISSQTCRGSNTIQCDRICAILVADDYRAASLSPKRRPQTKRSATAIRSETTAALRRGVCVCYHLAELKSIVDWRERESPQIDLYNAIRLRSRLRSFRMSLMIKLTIRFAATQRKLRSDKKIDTRPLTSWFFYYMHFISFSLNEK